MAAVKARSSSSSASCTACFANGSSSGVLARRARRCAVSKVFSSITGTAPEAGVPALAGVRTAWAAVSGGARVVHRPYAVKTSSSASAAAAIRCNTLIRL